MSYTREEQETVIRFDSHKGSVSVYTAQPAVMRKLQRAGHKPKRVTTHEGEDVAWAYEIPFESFGFRVNRKKREMTDEQRAKIAERMKKARAAGNTEEVEEEDEEDD